MEKQKWFYPLQKEVRDFFKKTYLSHSLMYQFVSGDRVIEIFIVSTKKTDCKEFEVIEVGSFVVQAMYNKGNKAITIHRLDCMAII